MIRGARLALTLWLLFNVWRAASWPVALSLTLVSVWFEMAGTTFNRLLGGLALLNAQVAKVRELQEQHYREVSQRVEQTESELKEVQEDRA